MTFGRRKAPFPLLELPVKIKDIKPGKFYKTAQGVGKAERVGGTHPPSVQFTITHPFPRGRVFLLPREVHEETTDPAAAASLPPLSSDETVS